MAMRLCPHLILPYCDCDHSREQYSGSNKQSCTACRVTVLGPPLSGKTSHCQALSGSLGLPLIQVGPLLQARAAAGDALLQEVLQSDGLIPDSKYLEVITQRLQQQDCIQAGWLLDGFPHTLTQVQYK